MKSLRELYRIGVGPSSSHTMAPYAGCTEIKNKYGESAKYQVTLYGSLSATGKGHGTDSVIKRALGEDCTVIFDNQKTDLPHPKNNKSSHSTSVGEESQKRLTRTIQRGRTSLQSFTAYSHPKNISLREKVR